jgi:Pentapeptide repeats (9 copies)
MADETAPEDKAPAEEQADEHVKDFFLALATKGKKAWNAWRRDAANKDVRVTFASVDFSEAPRDEIDFSGFEFGDRADFSRCKWRGLGRWVIKDDPKAFRPGCASFSDATFGDWANFNYATFGDAASFNNANFGACAAFKNATFGRNPTFTNASFGLGNVANNTSANWTSFTSATFDHGANFNTAIFGLYVSFSRAAFDGSAQFRDAIFRQGAIFNGAIFGNVAWFTNATFDSEADFTNATFGDLAEFDNATFGKTREPPPMEALKMEANFSGATFGNGARFNHTLFKSRVVFTGKSPEQWDGCYESTSQKLPWPSAHADRVAFSKQHKNAWQSVDSGPNRFLSISFANARFYRDANFSRRSFEQVANFTNARFYRPPDFDAETSATRIDFTGAYIGFVRPGRLHWTFDSGVPVRLRALRKIAEDTKNHDLERDLYIEERKAERGVYIFQLHVDLINELDKLGKKLKDISKDQTGVMSKWWHEAAAVISHAPRIALITVATFARFIARLPWIFVMGLYWALADYGRSFLRPFAWLIASWFFFYWSYTAALMPETCFLNADKFEHALRMLALGNAVPFVGPLTIDAALKKLLFCAGDVSDKCLPLPPEGFQLLVIAQNVVSIILVFFIGLALRNYYKIK